jgi:hypothetical protein
MDESFLSQPEVIAASRAFVCVRLTTYENEQEGEFLKAFFVTRSGELENTVFTILAPDGRRPLARTSRSARQTFGDARRMAETMNRIGREYSVKESAAGRLPELPTVPNVRLAINVAACDNRPLVVLFASDETSRRALEERLRPLAWSEAFLGQFVYATTSDVKELAAVEGVKAEPCVLVIQPDRFGLKGRVLVQLSAASDHGELVKGLQEGAAQHQRETRTFANHVRAGHEQGILWETVIPVTDPMERRARERGRKLGPNPD